MLDYNYIEQIRALGGKEAKLQLDAYAQEFGVSLQRNKSFDNMLLDLENAEKVAPESSQGFTTSDLIDSVDEVEASVEETQEYPQEIQEDLVVEPEEVTQPEYVEPEPIQPEYVEPEPIYTEPEQPEQSSDLPEGFVPKFNLIGNPGYYTLNWAIYEWIAQNQDWKQKIHEARDVFQETLYTLLYYIKTEGSVTIRETRNSQWYTLT